VCRLASAEGFIAAEKLGADTAEASRKAAEEGMREMSRVYKAKGEKLYLPEEEAHE
jgi:phosphomethylpyrimidine synthase